MEFFSEHVRILGAAITLFLGGLVLFYIYSKKRSVAYPAIQGLNGFIIYYNSTITLYLISKYLELNVSDQLSAGILEALILLMILFLIITFFGMEYSIWKIATAFEGKKVSRKARWWIFSGLILIITYYLLETIFLHNISSLTFAAAIFGFSFLIEAGLLTRIMVYGRKNYMFSLVFLSRIIFPAILYVILKFSFGDSVPDLVATIYAFSVLVYQNLVPFIWFRFFFLPQSESLSIIFEQKQVFDSLIKKYNISERELEIIKLIIDGKSNSDIQKVLHISFHTVKNHLYNIYKKCGISTKYELIHLVGRL